MVGAHACHGRVSYDARLVAAMRTHGITRLLTFNGADFVRFPGITILDPATFENSYGAHEHFPMTYFLRWIWARRGDGLWRQGSVDTTPNSHR